MTMDMAIRLVIVLLALPSVFNKAAAQTNLIFDCGPQNAKYTSGSSYELSLRGLLSGLSSTKTSAQSRASFSGTVIVGTPESVCALFVCLPGYSDSVCSQCFTNATEDILGRCPNAKVAMAWYDECLLYYYSNQSSFPSTPATMSNKVNISLADQQVFSDVVRTTLSEAKEAVASSGPGPLDSTTFAVRESNLPLKDSSVNNKLYTLVQCGQVSSSTDDCSRCLDGAFLYLPSLVKQSGGGALSWSCFYRFETYRFYNVSAGGSPDLSPPPPGNEGTSTVAIVGIIAGAGILFLAVSGLVIYYFRAIRVRKQARSVQESRALIDIPTEESLQFDLHTIQAATKDFSEENKLGQGGFGEVHKGVLDDGREIAVKRLSRRSTQGGEEFKNEVIVVAKLQHRNLARLVGFCLERNEKLLVYEFVPNKSLDFFLFDSEKRRQLDWSTRLNIIRGIARGLMYLHEDSRLRIIHRDLKSSNILLDENMNPKISDFGMAKIFCGDQVQASTDRIVGTYGYMAPEYAMRGEFSVKSDVYSFGVLLLEIIAGRRNNSFYRIDGFVDLISYVWKHWTEKKTFEVVDPNLASTCTGDEVARCIQIGLLCVQEDPTCRPTMTLVIMMLTGLPAVLPSPQKPGFCPTRKAHVNSGRRSESEDKKWSTLFSVDEAPITEASPR